MAPVCSPAVRDFACSTTLPVRCSSWTVPWPNRGADCRLPLIEVRSHDEALAWAQRFPAPFPGQSCCIEVPPLMGGIDLPPEDAERIIRGQLAAIKQGR